MSILLDEFIETLNSDYSKKSYEYALKHYIDYFADKDIFKLDNDSILFYLNSLTTKSGSKIKNSNFNQRLYAIKSFYKWISITKNINLNEITIKNKRAKRYITKNEVINKDCFDLIIENCNCLRDKLFFILMYEAGLKASEALNLKLGDINCEFISINGKSKRQIPVTPSVTKLLKLYLNQERDYVTLYSTLLSPNIKTSELALFVDSATREKIGYQAINSKFKLASVGILNKDGTQLSLGQLRYSFVFDQLQSKSGIGTIPTLGLSSRSYSSYID